MKKILCIIVSCLCAAGADAQSVAHRQVRASEVDAARTEGNLFVSMNIDVADLELGTDMEIVVTPVLESETGSMPLEGFIVAGRTRYYRHLRNDSPLNEKSLYRAGRTRSIEYRTAVPYADWMAEAKLTLATELRGCTGEEISHADDLLATLDFAPKTFAPVFVYIPPKGEAVKMREAKGSAFIDFPVNRTEIYENYRQNPVELQKIRNTIDLVKNDADTRITAVTIKGYASPEGPYDNNIRLAKGRTETLKEYVRKQYDFPADLLATSYEPEDWEGLERFVESSDLKNRDGILVLIRGDLAPDAKDAAIKSTYPEDYAFLLKNVYPALRHSDYAVEYEVRAYTDVEEIKRLLKTQPQKLSLSEMYLAAEHMEQGSDEYNEVFEIAVRMFPEDATANLNAANSAMGRGDMKNAERYLTKAGDDARAVYARGVFAALSGDYDEAARLFGAAESEGIAEAAEALRQIERIRK